MHTVGFFLNMVLIILCIPSYIITDKQRNVDMSPFWAKGGCRKATKLLVEK